MKRFSSISIINYKYSNASLFLIKKFNIKYLKVWRYWERRKMQFCLCSVKNVKKDASRKKHTSHTSSKLDWPRPLTSKPDLLDSVKEGVPSVHVGVGVFQPELPPTDKWDGVLCCSEVPTSPTLKPFLFLFYFNFFLFLYFLYVHTITNHMFSTPATLST
jgi:hypothetical protein